MDHDHDEPGSAASHPDLDRRATLAKLGIGAAAAWAAPTILSVPAASAATVAPGCGTCDEQFVLNGDAESGSTASWVSTPAGNGATIQSVLWSDIAGQFNQPLNSGLRAFYIEAGTSTGTAATLVQRVEVPGCVGSPFHFTGKFSAMGTTTGQFAATSTVGVTYLDSNDDPLPGGFVFSDVNNALVPANVNSGSTSPILPAGIVAIRFTLAFELEVAPQAQGIGAGAFDEISFLHVCPPPP